MERADLGGCHAVDLVHGGTMLLGTLMPSRNPDAIARLAAAGITAFATDRIPRITRAQALERLPSMASIAGYEAVLRAANALPKYVPMLGTAAGAPRSGSTTSSSLR